MRNHHCPICDHATEPVLRLRFDSKLRLPTRPEFRHCAVDNFLFLADGDQNTYDEYYASTANDSYHREVSTGTARSPIAKLQSDYLVAALHGFFDIPRRVLDFGCGEACLLVELATNFPSSAFFGFEPGPAANVGSSTARALGLTNLSVGDLKTSAERGPFDLIIASHVIEHLLEFESLGLLNRLLATNGLFYVEVPDPLSYETHQRREFLYYFDRLHVNHFTPQALTRLAARYDLSSIAHFQYSFPYRDGGEYPALGMLLRKGRAGADVTSPDILEAVNRYIRQEQNRVGTLADRLSTLAGVLIWGAGDNFFRSLENEGPLCRLHNFLLLDRRSCEIIIGNQKYNTMAPETGIRNYDWPVVVTVSEGRKAIEQQIGELDPNRTIFFV